MQRGSSRVAGRVEVWRTTKTDVTSLEAPLTSLSTRGMARVAVASMVNNTTQHKRAPESFSIRLTSLYDEQISGFTANTYLRPINESGHTD